MVQLKINVLLDKINIFIRNNMAQIQAQNIGGKGNAGKYIDRCPKIYAAGIRSSQPEIRVGDCLKEYMVHDVVNNLTYKSKQLPKLKPKRSLRENDMRNAGLFTEGSQLINPPVKTKFQALVEDLKSTAYNSYWNKEVGKGPDLASYLPPNVDIKNTIFGKKTVRVDDLYNIIMPKTPVINENLLSDLPEHQLNRNYCKTSYNPNNIFGVKANSDRGGSFLKCCLTNERVQMGTSLRKPIGTAQRNYQIKNQAELGTCLTPNENINLVSIGHVFGKIEPKDNIVGCFTNCELNPEKELFKKCLAHLNTLRKCLSKKFDGSFFRDFYLQLRYLDSAMNGWLSKDTIYRLCITKYIRFNPSLIEPLLAMWEAINETKIEYKTFINIINFREPLPWLPKVWDIPPKCSDFTTTYMDMVKPKQFSNSRPRAGIPSGRYFDKDFPVTPDGCCEADRSHLSHESDVKACLCPSIFTSFGINHRDMFTQRQPGEIKRVFEIVEGDINEDMFNTIWKEATKYHPKGLVCYETFRRALNKYKIKRNSLE